MTRAVIHVLIHPLKTQQPSFNHQTRPECSYLSWWKGWLYWWGQSSSRIPCFRWLCTAFIAVYPPIDRTGMAAAVKLVNGGGEQPFPRLAVCVCSLHTSKSHKDRCTPTGVSSPSAARHAFLCVWPACSGLSASKVVPAKSATQTCAHAHEAVGSLCFGLILLNWKKTAHFHQSTFSTSAWQSEKSLFRAFSDTAAVTASVSASQKLCCLCSECVGDGGLCRRKWALAY